MRLSHPNADLFVPDGSAAEAALARTTHLCIGAHQDDIEIMAWSGIAACRGRPDRHFTGVVGTDGAGSPRRGRYAGFSNTALCEIRREEQRRAASLGQYNLQVQLAHPSSDIKQPAHAGVAADLDAIFRAATPEIVYLHNPADSHDTHVAVLLRCLEAIRRQPAARRPARVLGCEVWRGLDWLPPADKVALDTSPDPALALALLQLFDSQVAGGKRYDEATLARWRANATFLDARSVDQAPSLALAMDLTPLIADNAPDVAAYTLACVDRLRADIESRLRRFRPTG